MPLDALKVAHIQAVIARTYASRQKTVVFVTQSGSSYSYTAVSVIFRKQKIIDPQIPDQEGGQPRLEQDAIMIVPIATSLTGLLMVADTPTATAGAVAASEKFEIIEALTTGIIPTGSKKIVRLRKFV